MKVQKVSIKSISISPDNPRTIKKDKFEKLKKSIMEFPEMMELRPIIVDENNIVLGGNMRLQACLDLKYKEVPIVQVTNLTDEQKKEFVIKDNASFGEWDWDVIANEWDAEELEDWGLDVVSVDWDKLDYIDEDINKPELTNDLTIKIGVPKELQGELSMIEEGLRLWLNDNYVGCEVK